MTPIHADNLLVIEGHAAIAAAYLANFETHQKHCRAYVAPHGGAAGASAATRPGR